MLNSNCLAEGLRGARLSRSLVGPGGNPGEAVASIAGWIDGGAANGRVSVIGRADGTWTGGPKVNSIEWLQAWYQAQCNGEWEHRHGVSVETLDNPGWQVKIDLTGTSLQNLSMKVMARGEINHVGLDGEQDWLQCKVENNRFEGAGGPLSLLQICDVFMNWVESKK